MSGICLTYSALLHLKEVLIVNDAGRIGFVIRDDYDNNVQYDFLDVVYYHGNSYVAKKLTLGNIPNENNEYWHILTAGGVRVKGDAESEYRDGDVNITKENIGLANTEDKSSETIRSEITSENVTNALGYTPMNEDLDTYGQKESPTGSEKVIVNDDGEVKQVEMSKVKPAVMQGATETSPGLSGLVPAPKKGIDNLLMSDGTWIRRMGFESRKMLGSSGWYRIALIQETASGIVNISEVVFLLKLSRSWNNGGNESFFITIASSGTNNFHYNVVNASVNGEHQLTKLRVSKKGTNAYLELYYSKNADNFVAYCLDFDNNANVLTSLKKINFEPATEDETVISEYTIPDKDDISTSKSLTNFTEIPEGADMHDYIKLGNYSCSTNSKANSLLNCPLNSAFTLDVSKGVGEIDNIIIQTFFDYLGTKIVKVVYVSGSGWRQPNFFYSAQGTPPANKLWGTDANGNVGWIDPP